MSSIMGVVKDVGQKVRGKVKQIQGDVNQSRGKGIKGGLQKLAGKLEEAEADIKLKARKNRAL